ncbi:probable imidazolonepropionase [Amphiprion ocellaris]|uniref:probable imidazolonepropionase n=1 Tax=Amphiprion ocellaris TaxID=80972 RepID=UPI0024115EEA|nr:probable imidazolonepropionase [Amphiprion ocellaris]
MSRNYRLLVKNAKQVVLICNNGEKYLTKHGMQNLCVIENGSVVIGSDGLIKAVGPAETIRAQYSEASFDRVIDATGMCVLPDQRTTDSSQPAQTLGTGPHHTGQEGFRLISTLKLTFSCSNC